MTCALLKFDLSIRVVSGADFFLFSFTLIIGIFCYAFHSNLSFVMWLHLACSILMSDQLSLLVLSTFCVCKL